MTTCVCVCVCVCVCARARACPLFNLLNHLTDFDETLYEYYGIGAHYSDVPSNFLQFVTITKLIAKLVIGQRLGIERLHSSGQSY